jgi:hypothetical protein
VPAGLNDVSMTPVDTEEINSKYKIADYDLKFTPTLPIRKGIFLNNIMKIYLIF